MLNWIWLRRDRRPARDFMKIESLQSHPELKHMPFAGHSRLAPEAA
jgi:hypothetical protein